MKKPLARQAAFIVSRFFISFRDRSQPGINGHTSKQAPEPAQRNTDCTSPDSQQAAPGRTCRQAASACSLAQALAFCMSFDSESAAREFASAGRESASASAGQGWPAAEWSWARLTAALWQMNLVRASSRLRSNRWCTNPGRTTGNRSTEAGTPADKNCKRHCTARNRNSRADSSSSRV
jgi:hypothetical protein